LESPRTQASLNKNRKRLRAEANLAFLRKKCKQL
jgi:hypothetical protein